LIYNEEDDLVKQLSEQYQSSFQTTPYRTPDFIIANNTVSVSTPYGEQELQIFGSHNMQNMEAARKVCHELVIDDIQFYKAIATFQGAARRFEKIKETENFVAYRDFAHAPSKLKATLKGAREQFANHHLVTCFELHTYSSLSEAFLKEYDGAMSYCDAGAVFFSNHALQLKGLPTLSKETVKNYFNQDNLTIFDNKDALLMWIQKSIQHSTKPVCLLLMSSGTFDGMNLEL
jgi:UDP-N-acetylmuramate: L-alanyl-gamma-D-glutamyl-meso-diaminopimelate ligase